MDCYWHPIQLYDWQTDPGSVYSVNSRPLSSLILKPKNIQLTIKLTNLLNDKSFHFQLKVSVRSSEVRLKWPYITYWCSLLRHTDILLRFVIRLLETKSCHIFFFWRSWQSLYLPWFELYCLCNISSKIILWNNYLVIENYVLFRRKEVRWLAYLGRAQLSVWAAIYLQAHTVWRSHSFFCAEAFNCYWSIWQVQTWHFE